MNNLKYSPPDQAANVWAVTEYFDRDIHEKNSASIAMAMSQLDQDDPWQFANRLLIEATKYNTDVINSLTKELSELYYGDGKIPEITNTPIPLYFLRADSQTDRDEVRVRGIYISGSIENLLPWETWHKLKLESVQKIYECGSKLIAQIDNVNNFSSKLKNKLDEIEKLIVIVDKLFKIPVEKMIIYEFITNDENRNFTREKKDFMTFKRESPNADNKKYKIFSRDYFYNLQMLISQVFNANEQSEIMLHLVRVSVFISNKMYTRSRGKIFVMSPKDPKIFSNFVKLVYRVSLLNEFASNHQYFTSDERLSLMSTLFDGKGSLMNAGTKMMSLINYILTVIPYQKTSTGWGMGVLE